MLISENNNNTHLVKQFLYIFLDSIDCFCFVLIKEVYNYHYFFIFYFILIYFSSIVKQAHFCLYKSHSNPFLEPTSTKQLE